MKKVVTVILLFIAFMIIYFLQVNFFNWFTISGIMPNLFIIFILFIGLYAGSKIGTAFGIIFGILIDFLGGTVIRRISYSFRNYWLFTEDTWKRIYLKIVK